MKILVEAKKKNLEKVINMLKKFNFNNINNRDEEGNTLLIYAVRNKWDDIFNDIIYRCDPSIINNKGRTALIYACKNKMNFTMLELILTDQSNPSVIDRDGNTALIYACKNKMNNIDILIETGESNPSVIDRDGKTALIHLCYHDDHSIACKLIETGQSNPSVVDNDGKTALIYYCCSKSLTAAIMIFETGDSNPLIVDNEGNTAFKYACEQGDKFVLGEKILDVVGFDFSSIDNTNSTPLIHAAKNICLNSVSKILKHKNINPEIVDTNGYTALMYLCFYNIGDNNAPDLALDLIENHNSNPFHMNKYGSSALYFICYYDDDLRLKRVFFKIIDMISNTIGLDYIFTIAARQKFWCYTEKLIELRISPYTEDDLGFTAYDYLKFYNIHPEYLIEMEQNIRFLIDDVEIDVNVNKLKNIVIDRENGEKYVNLDIFGFDGLIKMDFKLGNINRLTKDKIITCDVIKINDFDNETREYSKLNINSKISLLNYTKYWDRVINLYIRSGRNRDVLDDKWENFGETKEDVINAIERTIDYIDLSFREAAVITEPQIVFRGTQNGLTDPPYLGLNLGYLSTSIDELSALKFSDELCCFYEMHLDVGVPYIKMYKSHFIEEREILLPRGLISTLIDEGEYEGRKLYIVRISLSEEPNIKHSNHEYQTYSIEIIN